MYHLIAVLNSMCIHLWCVTLLRDRMVWNIIWWNQLWVLDGMSTPLQPLCSMKIREFGAEHALVGASIS